MGCIVTFENLFRQPLGEPDGPDRVEVLHLALGKHHHRPRAYQAAPVAATVREPEGGVGDLDDVGMIYPTQGAASVLGLCGIEAHDLHHLISRQPDVAVGLDDVDVLGAVGVFVDGGVVFEGVSEQGLTFMIDDVVHVFFLM